MQTRHRDLFFQVAMVDTVSIAFLSQPGMILSAGARAGKRHVCSCHPLALSNSIEAKAGAQRQSRAAKA